MDQLTRAAMPAPTRRTLATDIHPRPQLARREWHELDGAWQFAFDDADVGLRDGWMHDERPFTNTIVVPFPPESPASGIGDTALHEVLWYRRSLRLIPSPATRCILHFGAVDHSARVWVNGSEVVQHHGGHTPFEADITVAMRSDGEQVIVVRAQDAAALDQPRGKQHWSAHPDEIWYERTSGIWQPVWIEEVSAVRIAELRWTADIEERRVGLHVRLDGALLPEMRLHVTLHGAGGVVADDTYSVTGRDIRRDVGITIGAPSMARRRDVLWSPEHPNLLDAELEVLVGDFVVDTVQSYVGLRTASVRDNVFQLNGRPYYLRFVLHQGYWPASHLAAPTPDALRDDVKHIKDLGFNGVRVHQKAEDPRFLYWCDRLGLLVWEELPSAYVFSPTAARNLTEEWLELLQRDYSHPCIVTWVPFNESWGVEWLRDKPEQAALVRALLDLAHALDSTRPVLSDDGWEFSGGEIIGVHDYTTEPAELRRRWGSVAALEEALRRVQPNGRPILVGGAEHRDEPVVLSEFGGITFEPARDAEWFGYGVVPDSEALASIMEELFSAVLDSSALAGFCYTQLCDTRQETNGILTADREPKVDPARVRAMVRRRAASIPAESLLGGVLQRRRVTPRASPGHG